MSCLGCSYYRRNSQTNIGAQSKANSIKKLVVYAYSNVSFKQTVPSKKSITQIRPTRTSPVVRAKEQDQEDGFFRGTVQKTELVADQVYLLEVKAPEAAASYTTGGQYVIIKVDPESKPAYFAIASPPDQENVVLQFVIKVVPDTTAEKICNLKQGGELSISGAMGNGFKLETAPPAEYPTLIMLASGTGIAPIKAIIESGEIKASQRKDVRLYCGGEDDSNKLMFSDLFDDWEDTGVEVIPVQGEQIHEALARETEAIEGPKVAAIMVGGKRFMETTSELLEELNVTKILKNY